MKRLTIVLGALGALVMFSIYCAKVEFDNPMDSGNLSKFLDERLCANPGIYPLDAKGCDGSDLGYQYINCHDGRLREYAVEECVEGVPNIYNESNIINKIFYENRTKPKVIITGDTRVSITTADILKYKEYTHETSWEGIGVKVEFSGNHDGIKRTAVVQRKNGEVVTVPDGNVPTADTYDILYIATRTLYDGAVLADTARRELVITVSSCVDDGKPAVLTMEEKLLNPMTVYITDPPGVFRDPGATARTYCKTSVPVTKEFSPSFSTLINMKVLDVNGNGDTIVTGKGEFVITYIAKNPDNINAPVATENRTVKIDMKVDVLPTPVIVLTTYKFGANYGDVVSVDTVFRENGKFREPGYNTDVTGASKPMDFGIKAYYVKGGKEWDISDKIKTPAMYTNPTLGSGQTISYTIDRLDGEYETKSVTRAIIVTETCDLPPFLAPAPESEINPSFLTTIPKGTSSWNVNTGWSVTGKDGDIGGDDGYAYRLVGYGGLDPYDRKPGSYELRLVAIGMCGTPALPVHIIPVTVPQ